MAQCCRNIIAHIQLQISQFYELVTAQTSAPPCVIHQTLSNCARGLIENVYQRTTG